MADPVELLKLLGDSTRLRILILLHREPLSVAELQEILDMGQSRISSHLALLKQSGLVEDRREGKRSYYSAIDGLDGISSEIFQIALKTGEYLKDSNQDLRNLNRILDKRRAESEAYFNMVAGKLGKKYCPGRTWEAMGHLLLRIIPAIDIADLGAGEGVLSQLLARRARHVYCIDNSQKMVEVGTQLAVSNGFENLEYRLGNIEQVPMENDSVDVAILSQALHHAVKPIDAIEEAFRILRPGGQVIILDLNKHNFEKARELYADQWLGFSPNRLYHWLRDTGFLDVSVDPIVRENKEPFFETLLACGNKPA